MASGHADAWYRDYEKAKALATEVLNLIQERNSKAPVSAQDASRLTALARRKVGLLGSSIEALGDLLESSSSAMTEVEKNVRRDMISTLRSSRQEMQSLLRRDNHAQNRAQLMESSGSKDGQRGQETVHTAERDNQGLLQMQRQTMNEQDQELAELDKNVQSTRHIALTINEELGLQERLLDDLHEDVDVVDSRMRAAQKKLSKVMKQSGTCKSTMFTILLMLIIMVVIIVCFKLTKLVF